MIFIRLILFFADITNDFLDKNCPFIAGAISFYTLFAIFPLFLAVVSVLGFILGAQSREEHLLLAGQIAGMLPVSSDYVSQTVTGVVRNRALTGVFSIIGLLWASTAAFGAVRKGINSAWGIKKTRPYFKERLIDFALVLGAGILLMIGLFSVPTIGVIKEATYLLAPESERFTHVIWDIGTQLVYPGLSFLTLLILYDLLPNTDVKIKNVWPGALLASIAFNLVNLGFVWYVQSFSERYNVIYGSVGAVVALLSWVYLSAIIVLLGALVTSRYSKYVEFMQENDKVAFRTLYAGFSRVRLKVVGSSESL